MAPSTSPTTNTLQSRLTDLLTPLILLLTSLSYLPATLLSSPTLILSPSNLRSKWFANLWKHLGPQMALSPEQTPYISSLFTRARGTVLELGPGAGDQMRHFMSVVQAGKIDRVIGAEPNVGLHERLLANAKGVGLEGKYIALAAGAEPSSLVPALHRAGLFPERGAGEGVFDTIICVKSMCSAPQGQMEEICGLIHGLLKPGGEFLFFEHVGNETDWLTMAWAWVLGWIWPLAMGGCHLNGRVDHVVKGMGVGKGAWENVDVRNTREFMGWNVFRYVVGVCRR